MRRRYGEFENEAHIHPCADFLGKCGVSCRIEFSLALCGTSPKLDRDRNRGVMRVFSSPCTLPGSRRPVSLDWYLKRVKKGA